MEFWVLVGLGFCVVVDVVRGEGFPVISLPFYVIMVAPVWFGDFLDWLWWSVFGGSLLMGAMKLVGMLPVVVPYYPNFPFKTPSLEEVRLFLEEDDTSGFTYIPGVRTCDWFAKRLKSNGRRRGIPILYITLERESDSNHAINAVRTADYGLVFIEPQQDRIMTREEVYDTWGYVGIRIGGG